MADSFFIQNVDESFVIVPYDKSIPSVYLQRDKVCFLLKHLNSNYTVFIANDTSFYSHYSVEQWNDFISIGQRESFCCCYDKKTLKEKLLLQMLL